MKITSIYTLLIVSDSQSIQLWSSFIPRDKPGGCILHAFSDNQKHKTKRVPI